MLSPDSPLESVFWDMLPIAVRILAAAIVLATVVCLVLAYRLSKRSGYLLLALAAVVPAALSLIGALSRRPGPRRATPADAQFSSPSLAYVQRAPVHLPLVEAIACGGAFLLYRDEKRKVRPAEGSDAGDRAAGRGAPGASAEP